MDQTTTQGRTDHMSGATQVLALRLRPDEIAALEAFGRTIGCSAAQVLKLAGGIVADGQVAITAEEANVFRAVAEELREARDGVAQLEVALRDADGFQLAVLDEALAKLIAALAVFEAYAQTFADRRKSLLRVAVVAAQNTRTTIVQAKP
jgi:VIT1/CCC1 family predicted Fe2+/Mn2+ transporter